MMIAFMLVDVAMMLPENQFIRVHRSFIIALNKIEKIAKQELLVAGVDIPVGASYEEKVNEIRERIKDKR